jgi:pimeloyl-ACP methyl ester carboxylesterase
MNGIAARSVHAKASNPIDGVQVSFDATPGDGQAVVLFGGFLDSIDMVRATPVARTVAAAGFRPIYVDHRGLGGSDKPHDPSAYEMRLRAADATAVLDALDLERAHFIGTSWGGRLCFGIGEHAPDRVLSLVVGGQQPYAWPDSPLTRAVTVGLAKARTAGTEAVVEALEAFWDIRIPEPLRTRYLENDAEALEAAWRTALDEGPISADLREWRIPCLIFIGSEDVDFIDGARRAAGEIPRSRFIELRESDHWDAHTDQGDWLLDQVAGWLQEPGR